MEVEWVKLKLTWVKFYKGEMDGGWDDDMLCILYDLKKVKTTTTMQEDTDKGKVTTWNAPWIDNGRKKK